MGMRAYHLMVSPLELQEYISDSSRLMQRFISHYTNHDTAFLKTDESWGGLFFLMTGKSVFDEQNNLPPLSWFITGPQVIDPEQVMGYTPAYYTTVEQTLELSQKWHQVSIPELTNRFNPEVMTTLGIYPMMWDEKESFDYLKHHFLELKTFYSQAVEKSYAVISFIS
jgi:hypothetical protein